MRRTQVATTAAVCVCALALGRSSPGAEGGAPAYLPGGEEVEKAVEARRGKTALSRLAALMEPGTWAELKTKVSRGLWSSPNWKGGRNKGGAGGLHIAGWTSDAHWDSRTGQFLYMGLRQTRRFIAYSEEKNEWRSIELDPKSENPVFLTHYGHIYGTNGFDPERSRFYHYYRSYKSEKYGLDLKGGISFFDVVTEKWTKLPAGPGAMALEYFTAMDGLIVLHKTPRLFSEKRQKWEKMAASPVDGYHSLMRHNPYRQEILIAGGNHNPNTVARITKDGKIEKLKDFPVRKLSVRGDKLTVDPQTGRYLLFQFHGRGQKGVYVYEFDSDKNEWRVVKKAAAGFPWSYYKRPYTVCAFIPEYNVIMFANGKAYLYKHDPSGKYPIVTVSTAGTASKTGKKK
jgi:hypothetical protein